MSEFKQYQDMFNCLQEGILVIKEQLMEPLDGIAQETKNHIYFVNDIGNRILQKVFKTKNYKNSDKLATKIKIFYEYKSSQS